MNREYKCIVIGASAGGIPALSNMFSSLPENFPVPVVFVQHLHAENAGVFCITYLNEQSKLHVVEASDKQVIQQGTIYMAPVNYHLLIEPDNTLSLSIDNKVNFSRPSVDVLFESAADVFQQSLVGIILTGANSDGAKGIKYIKESGGLTIVQDPKTAQAVAMPKAAIRSCQIDHIIPLDKISSLLLDICFHN